MDDEYKKFFDIKSDEEIEEEMKEFEEGDDQEAKKKKFEEKLDKKMTELKEKFLPEIEELHNEMSDFIVTPKIQNDLLKGIRKVFLRNSIPLTKASIIAFLEGTKIIHNAIN